MIIMNKCEMCGVEKIKLALISTPDGMKRVCTDCYNNLIDAEDLVAKIPMKPKVIRLYNVNIAKMGTYKDGDEIRYIVSIPKDRKEEFDFERTYDILFIKR